MILYIEDPIDSTKKLLDLINNFDQVAGYKINTQKYVSILYTSTELSERETKKTIPFSTATKKNKTPSNKFNQRGKKTCTQKTIGH